MEVSSLPDEITGGKKAIDIYIYIYSYLAQGEDGTQAKLRFNNQGAKISNRSIFVPKNLGDIPLFGDPVGSVIGGTRALRFRALTSQRLHVLFPEIMS